MDGLVGEAAEVHAALVEIGRARNRIECAEARWVVRAVELKLHLEIGMGSMSEYFERVLGYAPPMARERVRTSERLMELPLLRGEVESGQMRWTCARELARVVVPDTQEVWIAATRGMTLRQVEDALVGREEGDAPDSPRAQDPRTYLLDPFRGDELAAFRERKAELEGELGNRLTDGQAARLMAERSRGTGAADALPPRLPMMLYQCESCASGILLGQGSPIVLDAASIGRRVCDPRVFAASPEMLMRCKGIEIPTDLRRKVWARDGARCQVPWCRNHRHVEIHHIIELWNGGTHALDNLVCLCSAHHDAFHRGLLTLTGVPSTGLRFEDVYRRNEAVPVLVS